jgi:hypothetical protein
MRHDPQPDDPSLETDMGRCEECGGAGCESETDAALRKSVSDEMTSIMADIAASAGVTIDHLVPYVEDWLQAQRERNVS